MKKILCAVYFIVCIFQASTSHAGPYPPADVKIIINNIENLGKGTVWIPIDQVKLKFESYHTQGLKAMSRQCIYTARLRRLNDYIKDMS